MALKIEIEGTDGAGKTTAMKYLVEKLRKRGNKVVETREVGTPLSPICLKLRELVLSPESNLRGETMELIFSAMRFENDKLCQEYGDVCDFIVSDRGWLSHLAYTDHNVDVDFTSDFYLNFMANYTQMPDIVIYFEINSETALERRAVRGDAEDVIEQKGVDFQEKVRWSFEKYLSDKSLENTNVFVVDANKNIGEVQEQLDNILEHINIIHNHKLADNAVNVVK
jgi:dTMP kinase